MTKNSVKIFLRIAIALGFLSAVADRFGLWSKEVSAWGTWGNFVQYTEVINPWFPSALVPTLAIIATAAEIV
ncbi:MAG: DoxX family protein, partial [Gelidibacter sp.]